MEQIKDKKVWIYFIKADPTDLSEKGRLRERATFFITQEIARSGLLDRIYLLDNKLISEQLQDVSIADYWNKINETISSAVHMLNYFINTEKVLSTFSDIAPMARIQTLGVIDVESSTERLFYNLQFPRHRLYYYAINEDKLKTDSGLLPTIKNHMREQTTDTSVSNYSIYETSYEHNYGYVELFSSFIQEQDLPER